MPLTDIRVSVILPTRGRPHLLPRAVASVLDGQTLRAVELIVVDDNPASARAETAVALAPWREDARLHLLVNPQSRNAAVVRNVGLAAAQAEWVSYLDDDDAYAPDKLQAQLAAATRSGSPLVLCGARYHLGARERCRQCGANEFAGADLVLRAQAGAPLLLHRRAPDLRFDETLAAGEDAEFFFRLVAHWRLKGVPNVPQPLVEVYPQSGHERTNARAEALWRAARTIAVRHGSAWPRDVRRVFVARARLQRAKWPGGSWRALSRASYGLWAVGGRAEMRTVLNTWAYRTPWLRRFVVS
jgi:glycosyltransferase involved in cell wall biosynthesis